MKRNIFCFLILSFVLFVALALQVEAQTNRGKIALSGIVPAGSHPTPGTEVLMDLTFQLEDGVGTVLYGPESQTGVPVDGNGVFRALLGAVLGADVLATTIHADPNLVIRVTDTVSGLQTLVLLSSSGYAHSAEIAGSAAGVADNSVGSAQIVDGSVGEADVDSSQIQRRVVGVCAPGQAIREIDASGNVVCETGGGGGDIPAGAIVIWRDSATCPAGFTRVVDLDGRYIKGDPTPGVIGGSSTHSHSFSFTGETGPAQAFFVAGGFGGLTATRPEHFHQFSVSGPTSPASNDPPFATVLFCRRGTGALMAAGDASANPSDVALKENLALVDGKTVLARLAAIPIQTWNYKSQDRSIRHMGPTAQDFYAAFGLGEDDKHINTIDAGGIALVSIQALERRTAEQREEIEALRAENSELKARLEVLERSALAKEALAQR